MSWCDKLASTPAVGLKLEPQFVSGNALLDAFSTLFKEHTSGRALTFTIDQQGPFSLIFSDENGFQYSIDQSSIAVTFNHRWGLKYKTGKAPEIGLVSLQVPYTQLLEQACTKLVEATMLLTGATSRAVLQIGVVANINVELKDVPPGIKNFISYLSKPWNGEAEFFTTQIAAKIKISEGEYERCLHTVNKPENLPDIITMQFDWQTVYNQGQPFKTKPNLANELNKATRKALVYFEELAEGERFDENGTK